MRGLLSQQYTPIRHFMILMDQEYNRIFNLYNVNDVVPYLNLYCSKLKI